MGRFPPFKKRFYQGPQGCKKHKSYRGYHFPKGANSKSATPPKIFEPPILGVVLKWIFLAIYTSCTTVPSTGWKKKMWAKVQEVAVRSKIRNFQSGGPGPQILTPIPGFSIQCGRPQGGVRDGPDSSVYSRTV